MFPESKEEHAQAGGGGEARDDPVLINCVASADKRSKVI